jgi:phage-related protein
MQDTAKSSDKLGDEVKKTGDDATDAGAKFEKLGGVLKGVGAALGASMAAIGTAAAAAGKKLYDMAKGAADAADNVDKQSQRLGMSRQSFQEWDYILSQNGVSIDSMNTAMKSMTANMADLAKGGNKSQETLVRLGISVGDLKNLRQEEVFEKAVVALQKMPEGYEKARLAQQLFGKQGQEMLPMLNTSKGSIEELKARAHEYGMVMSDDAVTAGVKFTDSLDTLQRSAKGLMNQIGAQLLPGLNDVVMGFAGVINGSEGASKQLADGAKSIVSGISGALPAVIEVLSSVAGAVAAVAPEIVKSLVSGITENISALIEAATGIVTALLGGVIEALPALTTGAVELVLALVNGILENLPALLEAAVQMVTALVQGIGAALPELIPAAVNAVLTIVQGLLENLPLLLGAALQLILGLAQGLLDAIPSLIEQLPAIINAVVDFFIEAIPLIIQAGLQLLSALVDALPEIITAIIAVLPEIITSIVTALVSMNVQIAQAGVTLLVALIASLPDIIVRIVASVPKIITGLVEGFQNGLGRMKDVGKALLNGIWEGIANLKDWLIGRIRSLGGMVTAAIKSVLGIHSPSSVFRDEVGANLALGLGEGFESAMKDVSKDMQNAVPTDFDIDANLTGQMRKSVDTQGVSGFSLTLHIGNFYNNTAQDLRQLADELSTLMADGIRRKGAVAS